MNGDRELPMQVVIDLLNRRFDAMDVRLDDIYTEARKTNGRVNELEKAVSGIHPRVNHLGIEMRDAKADIRGLKQTKEENGENRRIRMWDVWVVAGTILALLGFLKMIGKIG